MTGVEIHRLLEAAGGDEESLAFAAEISDYGNCVDIAFCFMVDGERFRGHLATLPKSAVQKMIDTLTPFAKKD
jgi:hypothetical protein